MAYFCNKTDQYLAEINRYNYDPKLHYEGEVYPKFDTSSLIDISEYFGTDTPFENVEAPRFVLFYMDSDGNFRTPLNQREFNRSKLSVIKPGRFVQKFFPNVLSEEELTDWVAEIGKKEIKFSTDFRDVYERSGRHASSCMVGKFTDWRFSPLDVYNGGDLQIAYEEDKKGDVTNRAIVWPEKKIYSGLYGNSTSVFKDRLEKLGYRSDSLRGARLQMLHRSPTDKNRLLMPYIDGDGCMSIGEDGILRIGRQTNEVQYWSSTTEGLVRYEMYYDEINDKNGYPHEMVRCLHPYNGNSVYVLRSTNPVVDPWDYLDMRKKQPTYYMENMYPRHFFRNSTICPILGVRVHHESLNRIHTGEYVSFEAILRGYRRCVLDGQLYPLNELQEMTNGDFIRYELPAEENQALQESA